MPDGRPFIKMEYFPGTSLAKHLEQVGLLSSLNRMIVVGRIANALAHAHEQKIIHRDLKPTNVLIDTNNHDIRLIDFSLGLLIEDNISKSRLTATKDGLGSSVYLAPELLENAKLLNPKSDIYSLGAVWFRLLTGIAPRGIGMEQILANGNASLAERELIKECLDLQPQQRPEGSALVERLRELVQTERKTSKS